MIPATASVVLGSGGVRPTLDLNFASARTLDPRIEFTRATSATYFDETGTLQTAASGAARIDFDPTTKACRGLLIEEARTNSYTYSQQFTNAAWGGTKVTVTDNAAKAPDGTTTAALVVPTTEAANHYLHPGTIASAATISIFAKKAGYDYVVILTSNYNVCFNLANGTVGATSGTGGTSAIQTVGDGWYRCSVTTADVSTSVYIVARPTNASSFFSTAGDGTSGIYLWGAQLEAGAFPTSYIATTTVAATRNADIAVMTGSNFSSWYNAVEGTFAAKYDATASGTRGIASADDNSANQSIRLRTSGTDPKFTVTDGGVDQCDLDAGTVATGVVYSFAGAYKANAFAASIAAGAVQTDSSGTIPTVDRLRIGADQAGNCLNGHVARLTYYPKALGSSALQRAAT